jgi:hypothetical protein
LRAAASKTYVRSGTSHNEGQGRIAAFDPALMHRNPPSRQHAMVAGGSAPDKEHHMLDVVMLALGLGLFVAAVGYTYGCERL